MRPVPLLVVACVLIAGAALVGTLGDGPSATEVALQESADRLIATSEIPGVITLVERDGDRNVVAAGDAVVGHRAARPEDRFWVGSVTKSFVAAVAMLLVAEGALRLDDRVSELLPGRLREGRRIRLRNLLDHTSGIPNYMDVDPWASSVASDPRITIPSRRLVSSVARLPLQFDPGSRASYSKTNTLVLAEILERTTGSQLTSLLEDRIFEPLGLDATTYDPGKRVVRDDQMHGYGLASSPPQDISTYGLGGPWADGGIVSSAHDPWRHSSLCSFAASSSRRGSSRR